MVSVTFGIILKRIKAREHAVSNISKAATRGPQSLEELPVILVVRNLLIFDNKRDTVQQFTFTFSCNKRQVS